MRIFQFCDILSLLSNLFLVLSHSSFSFLLFPHLCLPRMSLAHSPPPLVACALSFVLVWLFRLCLSLFLSLAGRFREVATRLRSKVPTVFPRAPFNFGPQQ